MSPATSPFSTAPESAALTMAGEVVMAAAFKAVESLALSNSPKHAGQFASQPVYFGPFYAFKLAAVHTRFEKVQWFLWNAEKPNEEGFATVVAQEPTALGAAAKAVPSLLAFYENEGVA